MSEEDDLVDLYVVEKGERRYSDALDGCKKELSDQLSQGKGRGQLFVKCDRARSGFFFFRSKERGEIKSDCNHW